MFSYLSAIKNNIMASGTMIHIATTHVIQRYGTKNIQRIMVNCDVVDITIVNKESSVSLFSDLKFVFLTDGSYEVAETPWYRTEDYKKH